MRADVAQCVIWHRRHTIPGLQVPGMPADMMRIDVEALSAHMSNLLQVLNRLGRLSQAPAILLRLRPAIDNDRWRGKIIYHRALVSLVIGKRPFARQVLAEAGPITATCDDIDLLQIQIDLNGSRVGFTETPGPLQEGAGLLGTRYLFRLPPAHVEPPMTIGPVAPMARA